jgi:hypothetical protein
MIQVDLGLRGRVFSKAWEWYVVRIWLLSSSKLMAHLVVIHRGIRFSFQSSLLQSYREKNEASVLIWATLNGIGWVTTHTLMSRDFEWRESQSMFFCHLGWQRREGTGDTLLAIPSRPFDQECPVSRLPLTPPLPRSFRPMPLPTLCSLRRRCVCLLAGHLEPFLTYHGRLQKREKHWVSPSWLTPYALPQENCSRYRQDFNSCIKRNAWQSH